MYAMMINIALSLYLAVVGVVRRTIKPKPQKSDRLSIMLTGNFYSDSWIQAQLEPMSAAANIDVIFMVAERPVPAVAKVQALYPSRWVCRLFGSDIGRLLAFVYFALKYKPDVVGGFHLLLNGLLALLVAGLTRARSVYICGGGIREVEGGGYSTENRIFRKLPAPDKSVERRLFAAVRMFDLVVVRGLRAQEYFSNTVGAGAAVTVITAGIDSRRYRPIAGVHKEYDLAFVGRLSEVKRVEFILEAIAKLRPQHLCRFLVVGDGPSRETLEKKAQALEIARQVDFVGWQSEVERFLNRAKIFILTSSSEGLSQAMLQGMLCQMPAIVSDVGELADVVCDGENGFVLSDCTPASIAEKVAALLLDPAALERMSVAAREAALAFDIESVGERWERVLRVSIERGSGGPLPATIN